MKLPVVLVAALVALTAPLTAATTPGVPVAPKVLPPEFARLDTDGGRTLMLTIDDGEGGVWREFPVSDAGLAAFSNALQSQNVALDPVVYGAELKEVGVFLHSWTLDGTPYMTVGSYLVTASQGKLRIPTLIVENVADLEGMTKLVGSVVQDDAIAVAVEYVPHAYGLAAPDLLLGGVVALIGGLVATIVVILVVESVYNADQGSGLFNLPQETYAARYDVYYGMVMISIALLVGEFGLGGIADEYYYSSNPEEHDELNLTDEWVDRPEVRFWSARKVAAGHDVWTGASFSRTGAHTGDGTYEFHAWKRYAVGPATRIDGTTETPAAVYARFDVDRHYVDDGPSNGPSEIRNHMTTTVGVSTLGADTPIAQVQMDEERLDEGDENDGGFLGGEYNEYSSWGIGDGEATYLPDEQHAQWSAGVVAQGEYVPLVGARTDSWHRLHPDVTNLGQPIFEWESERMSSVGVFAQGEFIPVAGARTWVERLPPELYAVFLALDGVGSQWAGDAEASVGTFVEGEYTPLAATRYDDDFPLHLYDHRAMVSAGTYVMGEYQPLLGATYDGVDTLVNWTLADEDERAVSPWQTSVGTFTLQQYRPIVGTRFEPGTWNDAGAYQESYQLGVYPLYYDPFIPVASVDYNGNTGSTSWILAAGDAPPATFDLVAYTPGPYAFPLAGVHYTDDAPDMTANEEFHVNLGVFTPEGDYTPIAGASYASGSTPTDVALSVVAQAAGGPRHREAMMTVGPYVDGAYMPVATIDTARSPV